MLAANIHTPFTDSSTNRKAPYIKWSVGKNRSPFYTYNVYISTAGSGSSVFRSAPLEGGWWASLQRPGRPNFYFNVYLLLRGAPTRNRTRDAPP